MLAMIFGVCATAILSTRRQFRGKMIAVFTLYCVTNVLFIFYALVNPSIGLLLFNVACLLFSGAGLSAEIRGGRSGRGILPPSRDGWEEERAEGGSAKFTRMGDRGLEGKILALLFATGSTTFSAARRAVYSLFAKLRRDFPEQFGELRFRSRRGRWVCPELDEAFANLVEESIIRGDPEAPDTFVLPGKHLDLIGEYTLPRLPISFISRMPDMLPAVRILVAPE